MNSNKCIKKKHCRTKMKNQNYFCLIMKIIEFYNPMCFLFTIIEKLSSNR